MNLNKTMLIGRITRDPELKALPTGMKICTFGMATNRTWKNKEGEKQEETDFHNIVSFGKQAETIAQYVNKGQLLYVEGRNQTRSWEDKDSGKKLYKTEIILESFQFGPKAAGVEVKKSSEEEKVDDDIVEYTNDDGRDASAGDIPF